MSVAAFDTLKFVRALRDKAKLSPEQAEGFADAIAEAVQSDLSTKADIEGVRADLREAEISVKSDLREHELRMEAKIAAAKAEIIKWMFGTIGFQTLIILGAVIALAPLLQP